MEVLIEEWIKCLIKNKFDSMPLIHWKSRLKLLKLIDLINLVNDY